MITAAALVASHALPASASGENWNLDNQPDNKTHGIWNKFAAGTLADTAAKWGASQLNQSNLNVSAVTNGDDVQIYAQNLSGNAGLFTCTNHNWFPNYHCDQSIARLDDGVLSSTNTNYWKAVACHELGHSGGLGEEPPTSTSCMSNPATSAYYTLSSADLNLINAHFP
jgi:hypothetical protein